jgi:hypothetical protein
MARPGFGTEEVKKRGGATRRRKYPGIKGPRPDKAAKRRAAAAATQAKTDERKEIQQDKDYEAYVKETGHMG